MRFSLSVDARWHVFNSCAITNANAATTYEKSSSFGYIPGNVNMDGQLTAADARLALRGSLGLEDYAPGSLQFNLADYNRDNDLTAGDARSILRASIGLDPFDGNYESSKHKIELKKGDVMFEIDGVKVIYIDSAKDSNGKYTVTVQYVNTTKDYREIILMWFSDGRYNYDFNVRLSDSHTFGNTATLKNVNSLYFYSLYCKVVRSAMESSQFSSKTTREQMKEVTAATFQIA